MVPENAMKWGELSTARGVYNWTAADAIANYAEENGKYLRCHVLVWHSQLPTWVEEGNWDNETLVEVVQEHIAEVVGRYKGKCKDWDVVNEALNEDGTYRETLFYNITGEAYIPIAFKAAAEADPEANLFYNDYNIGAAGNKTAGVERIIQLVQSYDAKIDGIGLQSHYVVADTNSYQAISNIMDTYTSYDLNVVISELDIRMELPSNSTQLIQQQLDYAGVCAACRDEERCKGITVWQFTDKYSWVPDVFEGEGDACPWDEDYNKKPAYYGCASVLSV
ncbi:putative xylanase 2 [Lineolata rhizophorae]|uniref:Beta-xylanase n=1 Tax=Lineolata rhizophorae TaxID=578093 RepID=A0A6A6NNQ3_9PEZI|nr:putative xylanase 2 [Lineolata rhizophorae]